MPLVHARVVCTLLGIHTLGHARTWDELAWEVRTPWCTCLGAFLGGLSQSQAFGALVLAYTF